MFHDTIYENDNPVYPLPFLKQNPLINEILEESEKMEWLRVSGNVIGGCGRNLVKKAVSGCWKEALLLDNSLFLFLLPPVDFTLPCKEVFSNVFTCIICLGEFLNLQHFSFNLEYC